MTTLVELNADNTMCVTVGADGLLRVWDTATGTVRAQRNADLSDNITCVTWCHLPDEVRQPARGADT